MIEILWNVSTLGETFASKALVIATRCLGWLMSEITKSEYAIDFNGYMLGKEKDGCSALLICADKRSQKKILEILQQPPEEYKEKYIACVPCNEPDPVHEQDKQNSETNEEEIRDET